MATGDSKKNKNIHTEQPTKEGAVVINDPSREDERLFPQWLSLFYLCTIYAVYLTASMLPALVIVLLVGLWFQLVPSSVMAILVGIISLDFAIPLGDRSRPNPKISYLGFRLGAEGMALYYPARSICVCAKQLNKEKSYILASWPHGLFGGGCHCGLVDFFDCGLQPIYSAASVMKYIPIVRRLHAIWGVTDVTKDELVKTLRQEKTVVHLVVGGIEEMFYSIQENKPYEQIVISKRKGFIRLALETGTDIIPHYTFGANQTYHRVFGPKSVAAKLSHALRTSIVVWSGRWMVPMGCLPYQVPLLSVAGEVFEVPRVPKDKVTRALVEKVHGDFCQALLKLFDTYKVVYVEQMGAPKEWLTKELKFEDYSEDA